MKQMHSRYSNRGRSLYETDAQPLLKQGGLSLYETDAQQLLKQGVLSL